MSLCKKAASARSFPSKSGLLAVSWRTGSVILTVGALRPVVRLEYQRPRPAQELELTVLSPGTKNASSIRLDRARNDGILASSSSAGRSRFVHCQRLSPAALAGRDCAPDQDSLYSQSRGICTLNVDSRTWISSCKIQCSGLCQ